MSKRWVGCAVLVVCALSSTAWANLTSTPAVVDVGDVRVGATGSAIGSAVSDGNDTLDHFHLTGANCGLFTITPEVALPKTIVAANPLAFTVVLAPTARGSVTCSVAFHDAAHNPVGTDFTIQGRGIAPIIGAPASTDFGSVRVANAAVTTAQRTVTITNTGDASLTIDNLATTGDYTLPNPPTLPATIAAGGSLGVAVRFDPTAPGTRPGTLDISSNDPAAPTRTANLTGVGTNAVIAVTDVDFGIVNLTQTATKTIAVTNVATAPVGTLKLASATISGGAGWFTFDANGFSCLGATTCTFGSGINAPASIGVRCTPPAGSTGSMTATVAVTSDSDGGGDNVSALTCTAGRADIAVDPTALAYGDVGVGATVVKTVTVTNTGNIDLTFTASKVGARAGEYIFSGCFSACVVTAGQNKAFTLSFTPTSAGAANITVNLASNDPDNATVAIPVTANAIAPAITAPATLAFGNVEVVTTSTKTLTVTNSGSADLIISSASLTANDGSYAIATGTTGAQTVAPGATASWDLTCTPAAQGAHAGTFTIASNALGAATTAVALSCTGTEGVLVTIPTSIDFGGVPENTTQTRSYRLRNTGNLTVSNIAAVLDPTTVGYSLDPATPIPTTLAAQTEVTLNIKFAPANGNDGGPATVTFTGTWGTGAKPLRTNPVLAITGDGLTTGFDVTPPALDFGDLRFDGTLSRTVCIVNTSQSSLVIQNPLTITPATGTISGELTAPTVRRKTCGTAGGTIVALPQTLAPGEQLEVTVVVDPANRTGAIAGTLTVTSNLTVNPTRTVALTANATAAMLAVTPGNTLDFGAVDIRGTPVTASVTITNTGQAPLDLGAFTRNVANSHFQLALPAAQTLAPGATLAIPVTYAPTVVNVPAEQVVLSSTVAGVLGGPTSQSITLRGRGIDREIQLGAPPAFPDTFRNPGDAAPVRAVKVENLGEAPLVVSAAMVTAADPDVWTLVDATPVTIPGLASRDFLVRFAPKTIGAAPPGTLVITNDDGDEMMAAVTLTGNGIGRNVAFNTMEIDVGYTGIGIPLTVDDALLVASMDPTNAFRIHEIQIEGDAFAIDNPPADLLIDPMGTQTFGVTFTPEAEGEFTATAFLYLDGDTTPQAAITLRGRAVFVDAHGSGGCAAGHDVGFGAILVVALAFALRRRRELAIACVLVVGSATARADNLVLSTFDPTPATEGTGFQLQSPDVGNDGEWVVSAVVSHATNPLVLDALMEGVFLNDQRVVERSTLMELGGAYAFLGRFEAGARMPIYAQDGQPLGNPREMFTTSPASGTARGDLTLHGKARLWKGHSGTLAAAAQLTLPTATDGAFTGVDKPSGRLLVLGALVPDTMQRRITLSANLGAIARARSQFANLEQGSGAAWALGVSVRALDRLWLGAEVFGEIVPSGQGSPSGDSVALSPAEWLAGVHWTPERRVAIALAGGRGLTSAAGAPALRGMLAISFTPGAVAPPTLRSLEEPVRDADGDGIADRDDRCPREAEDTDLYDDTDGCPELDNDGDGITDAADKCPLDPEDKDGFADADGCPDRDNDADGVADATDKCPNVAEDKDGFQDLDGCPEPDNDGDGLVDTKDKCPNEPETINGNRDDDGCPDTGSSVVVLSPDRIDTLDPITFSGTKLGRGAFNVLGQVAATLRAHAEIVRIRVTVHVQPTGDAQRDQDLSDRRATAIREWLVQWGIAQTRVDARGFGGTKPLVAPDARGAAAINDRVELIILDRK
ncbi:MAG TPA: choice-of-anchor D domain-containing protein [Kofleriaceae bacterium]|nr:choice-of-anchor D domain-containing protein [Kofleriaceae bacterium]